MIKPLEGRIFVKQVKAEEVTKGGIYLPETARKKHQEGIVVGVGDGFVTDDGTIVKSKVEVGDKVLFGKHSGDEVEIKGEMFMMLEDKHIMAVV